MNLAETLSALESMGTEQTRRMWRKHGAGGEIFGVKIGDMKKLVRKIRIDQPLAEQLFASGNADAQYFAGLIADPAQCTPELLDQWARASQWSMVSESMVAAIAAESPHGYSLGQQWIDSADDSLASTGWAALNHWVSIRPDEELDLEGIEQLLKRIPGQIGGAGNRTRSTMNNFVIGVGSFVAPLTEKALAVAAAVGAVEVDVGDTNCRIPLATDYINKVVSMGRQGRKRKHARC